MNRYEALAAACDLVAEALPVVVRREEASWFWSHAVGVTLDDVPCLQIQCIAIGPTRDSDDIHLELRVAGTSDEELPLFLDPRGRPEDFPRGPILARAGTPEYRWTRARDELRAEIAREAHARWAAWRTEAAEIFARGPAVWADACERVAALEDPLRWMALGAEERASDLAGLALPGRDAWPRAHWTAAWIGLGRVLDRIVPCDAATAARIANAAAMVRASKHGPGRA